MSHSSSPIDLSSEWHVLVRGERLGPLSRDGLCAVLDTHPDGWQASVWRLGMLDWRAAGSVSALTAAAAGWELAAGGPGAPIAEPVRVSAVPARDTAGELRVLSYEEHTERARAPSLDRLAEAQPIAPSVEATSDWSAVATSELRAFGTSELRASGVHEPSPAENAEWAAVATSELRAIGTSELRVLVSDALSAQATLSELRAFMPRTLPATSALPSVIVSGETSTELPSFDFRAESSAPLPAQGALTPTPRALPVYSHPPASRPPMRASLLIMGSLLLLSAGALGIALTLRWLRVTQPNISHAYAHAPMPPRREQGLSHEPTLSPPLPELLGAQTPSALDPIPAAPADDARLTGSARQLEPRTRERSREVGNGSGERASGIESVRVAAMSARVHVGADGKAQVVCSLPRGAVRPVLAELPGTEARWFAVRCAAGAVGWVQESDLTPLAR